MCQDDHVLFLSRWPRVAYVKVTTFCLCQGGYMLPMTGDQMLSLSR